MRRLIVICLLCLAGCGAPDAPPEQSGAAQRIVALTPHLAELTYAAGAGDRLVGVVEYSDFPPEVLKVERVGDAFRIDYEKIALLQPDLVLAWAGGNPPEMTERLRSLGYRVVEFSSGNLAAIATELEELGALAGTLPQAEQAAAALRGQIAELQNQFGGEQAMRVFWQISADPWYTVSGRHVISEIIAVCGGRNIFADTPGLASAVTLEAILTARPDIIIASVAPGDDGWKADWQRWEQVPAVRDDHLYSIDPDYVSRSGPRLAEGARRICAAIAAARARD